MLNIFPIPETEQDAGAAGLSLIYLLNIFIWLNMAIKMITDIESMVGKLQCGCQITYA